jgi:hypothetical protein
MSEMKLAYNFKYYLVVDNVFNFMVNISANLI